MNIKYLRLMSLLYGDTIPIGKAMALLVASTVSSWIAQRLSCETKEPSAFLPNRADTKNA